MRPLLWFLGGVAAALGVVLLTASMTPETEPVEVASRIQPEPRPHYLDVEVSEGLQSFMGQETMLQEPYTSGPSPDSLRFRFDKPVRLLGILVSVDISGPHLVEVVAGINTPVPYGLVEEGDNKHRDFVSDAWLIHTSDSNGGEPSKIDEHVWFPGDGFTVEPDDYVAVDAWLGNPTGTETGISPEVIVFYESGS